MQGRVPLRKLGFWYGLAACILKPLTWAFMKKDWRGQEHVPATGGVILAANHISHADPVALADYIVFGTARAARFLAKSSLFKGRGLVGSVMRGAGQIPVHRQTADASLALRDAVAALHRGECIAIYPEGTVTRDPQKWPMQAKTGVARLALLSGAPVVPIAQWGAQDILDSYRSKGVHLLPRHTMHIVAGPPVDLSEYEGRDLTTEVLRGATDKVMRAVTELVEQLRGETAPTEVHVHEPRSRLASDGRRSA
ncbi:MAG: 1-acyl-sn-glycerol-3-phosphate acyltransferase [Actinobacteria bacterium]|nr:1-acyl-sn-glycerol-3-phosphate acyltransferase [Actinomycetota bacterium]MCA1722501.1 1-acyl-sn-glycerol-3-phosphate acyltransferase [Actinomycetota bacterium]